MALSQKNEQSMTALGKSLKFCGMKLDIHELNTRRLDWDDKIPEDINI